MNDLIGNGERLARIFQDPKQKNTFVFQWWERAIKGVRWMPRHEEPMKDVATCDKSRGGGKQPLIRECPNGETRYGVEPYHYPGQPGVWVRGEVKHLSNHRKRK